jgi:hypothetical protein
MFSTLAHDLLLVMPLDRDTPQARQFILGSLVQNFNYSVTIHAVYAVHRLSGPIGAAIQRDVRQELNRWRLFSQGLRETLQMPLGFSDDDTYVVLTSREINGDVHYHLSQFWLFPRPATHAVYALINANPLSPLEVLGWLEFFNELRETEAASRFARKNPVPQNIKGRYERLLNLYGDRASTKGEKDNALTAMVKLEKAYPELKPLRQRRVQEEEAAARPPAPPPAKPSAEPRPDDRKIRRMREDAQVRYWKATQRAATDAAKKILRSDVKQIYGLDLADVRQSILTRWLSHYALERGFAQRVPKAPGSRDMTLLYTDLVLQTLALEASIDAAATDVLAEIRKTRVEAEKTSFSTEGSVEGFADEEASAHGFSDAAEKATEAEAKTEKRKDIFTLSLDALRSQPGGALTARLVELHLGLDIAPQLPEAFRGQGNSAAAKDFQTYHRAQATEPCPTCRRIARFVRHPGVTPQRVLEACRLFSAQAAALYASS